MARDAAGCAATASRRNGQKTGRVGGGLSGVRAVEERPERCGGVGGEREAHAREPVLEILRLQRPDYALY